MDLFGRGLVALEYIFVIGVLMCGSYRLRLLLLLQTRIRVHDLPRLNQAQVLEEVVQLV